MKNIYLVSKVRCEEKYLLSVVLKNKSTMINTKNDIQKEKITKDIYIPVRELGYLKKDFFINNDIPLTDIVQISKKLNKIDNLINYIDFEYNKYIKNENWVIFGSKIFDSLFEYLINNEINIIEKDYLKNSEINIEKDECCCSI